MQFFKFINLSIYIVYYYIHEGLKIQNTRVSNIIYRYLLPTVLVTILTTQFTFDIDFKISMCHIKLKYDIIILYSTIFYL